MRVNCDDFAAIIPLSRLVSGPKSKSSNKSEIQNRCGGYGGDGGGARKKDLSDEAGYLREESKNTGTRSNERTQVPLLVKSKPGHMHSHCKKIRKTTQLGKRHGSDHTSQQSVS
ncbi:hypothetical protein L1987_18852 [Smallanthus sonchifolius]|uniref:Uncharacterized protein n=1 Tax=Smallanthus sonchifolius TaxID=185202 RepID=A0ACB9J4C6_9ASTR|nr:hypothetical protein L1987_18852 [Smallanthus sonchifolius]